MATQQELERLALMYRRNLPVFCADLLKIKLESGGLNNFYLNNTQLDLHNRLENQLSKNGKVRALILKPRREGMSTYIGARFYHKTIYHEGWQTYILTHKHKATTALFKMVKLFHEKMPDEFRAKTSQDSKTDLEFSVINSGYSLGTAGSKSGGRSELAHCFHGSEVAFWDNADEVASSALNIVGDEVGTEVILESTGMPNTYFQEIWERAVSGDSDFEPIFYPWYKSERNRADPIKMGLIPTPEEKELMALYKGMDLANIAFRRNKLGLRSDAIFRREYPAVPADAFSADNALSYIKTEVVTLASQRENIVKPYQPRVLGCDPSSSEAGDPVGMVVRQGDKVTHLAEFNRDNVIERAHVIHQYIIKHMIDHTFIDAGGSGKEVRELLISFGVEARDITLIYFGGRATDNQKYPNKRNEMYDRMRSWLKLEGDIPNSAKLKQELSITKEVIDNMGYYVLESKKNMRKSPNLADALALTFAYPVRIKHTAQVESYA